MDAFTSSIWTIIISAISVILIGVAKAGFGGGVGILITPLMSLVIPPKFAIGVLLPILITCDLYVIYRYRGKWDRHNLAILLPGAVVGIVLGILFIDRVSDVELKRALGIIAIVFVILQFLRQRVHGGQKNFNPKLWHGLGTGGLAGFVSTVAHSAGVVLTMFLLLQKMQKLRFVGTMVLFFGIVNVLKLVPYFAIGLINTATLKYGLWFVPFVPVGVALGIYIHRRISESLFTKIIYGMVLIVGVQLLIGKNVFELFS